MDSGGEGEGWIALLVEGMEIESVEPCFADETKIRFIARICGDVGDLLPYLNALLPNATYVPDRPALTFAKGIHLITV